MSAEKILSTWNKLRCVPAGKALFSLYLGYLVPYTGTLKPSIEVFEPGHAKVKIKDRRSIRNHLNSIHAAALMNISELASGLAFASLLTGAQRAILMRFSIEYTKKGRGTLTAESTLAITRPVANGGHEVEAFVRDSENALVARATALWKVSEKQRE